MANGVLIKDQVAAMNVDALNRSAKGSVDIDNGDIFQLASKSAVSGEGEVWLATAPATSHLDGLWMAAEAAVVLTDEKYKGIDPDVRNFTIPDGEVFSAIKLQAGDIVSLTGDALTGTAELAYANAANAAYKLAWGASQTSDALSLKYLKTDSLSIGLGAIGSQRIDLYQFEVVAN